MGGDDINVVVNNVEKEMKLRQDYCGVTTMKKSKTKQRKSGFFRPKFRCFGLDDDSPTVDKKNEDGSVDMVSAGVDGHPTTSTPTHLIVMVNGIIGSAEDWRYAAKQFLKAYPHDVIVHCSERNTSTSTFDGIDVMGERLADEVISVIQRYTHLSKISFIGHSLGGLIARYAIALLHESNYLSRLLKQNGEIGSIRQTQVVNEQKFTRKIAGLEPMNFITIASPHLGSRAHNQVPLFCGLHVLEMVARQTSWFLGRTGRHLFLTDCDKGKPPLLLRMVNDCEGLPFMSSLQSFKRRVAYANVQFDKLVGWCTSSLRRKSELPKRKPTSRNDKYRHIVNEEISVIDIPQQQFSRQPSTNGKTNMRTQDVTEEMLTQLTKLSWDRIDVKFGGGRQRLLAHNTIQVQTYCINSAGADVIQHMIDHFAL
ncbi:hypothetical protein RND81_03G039900 [Saponaria officinalis]|uniref:DUF676 domain-containing protein n=1 Tax=Saponaria officinalis TaxID=3572 RepID=A0AAW1M2E8_SAPOF